MANLDYNEFRPCDFVWRMVLPANSLATRFRLRNIAGCVTLIDGVAPSMPFISESDPTSLDRASWWGLMVRANDGSHHFIL